MRVCTILFVAAMSAQPLFAATVSSTTESVNPATVSQSILLAHKLNEGSSDLSVRAIVTDRGMSTDVSPRYSVYLGFASYAEMGNITSTFVVVPGAFRFVSAERLEAGIYQVVTEEYTGDRGMELVTRRVDATKVFSDERRARRQCGDDFCDLELSSEVKVTEERVPSN